MCHRKIPSVHTLNITAAKSNQTDGFLEPAYKDISSIWPEPQIENLKYMVRQFAEGKQI